MYKPNKFAGLLALVDVAVVQRSFVASSVASSFVELELDDEAHKIPGKYDKLNEQLSKYMSSNLNKNGCIYSYYHSIIFLKDFSNRQRIYFSACMSSNRKQIVICLDS